MGIFVAPPKRNLLADIAVPALQQFSQMQDEKNEQSALQKLSQEINDETSPIELVTKLAGSKISPEKKQLILEGYKQHSAQKLAQTKSQGKGKEPEAIEDVYGFGRAAGFSNQQLKEAGVKSKDDVTKLKNVTKPEKKPRLSDAPIDPEQLSNLEKARSSPGYEDMDELERYQTMLKNNVSPVLAEKEAKITADINERKSKEEDKAYEAQKGFIDKTSNAYTAWESETKPKLLQLQKLGDKELITPSAAKFLEIFDIPLGVLENPSNELYQKVSQDLLKGLPETYGSRILQVEVENFLKTIPTLMNSAEGRRMIASNMLKLGEMKEVMYNEMRNQEKSYLDAKKPLPKDFQRDIIDNVKPQMEKINKEFQQLSELTSIPPNTVPYFDSLGGITFIPKDNPAALEWAEQNGKRIW